jgi:hypothetical protein
LVARQNAAHLAEKALKHMAMVTGDAGFDRGIFCLVRFNLQLATKLYTLDMVFEG